MTTEEKKIIEDNFDRMREVIQNTWLPIKNGAGDVVGETRLGTSDVFRLATALINEGFRLERKGEWLTDRYGMERSICSLCGTVYEGDGGNYCRNCGARMAEE
jgi:hypothetical protein